jgi:hypothetical protein
MFDEVSMGNPGKVPYCSEKGTFEPDCEKCYRPEKDNGDLIRSLMDSKLAEYLSNHNFCSGLRPLENEYCMLGNCKNCIRAWLRMPVKEGE